MLAHFIAHFFGRLFFNFSQINLSQIGHRPHRLLCDGVEVIDPPACRVQNLFPRAVTRQMWSFRSRPRTCRVCRRARSLLGHCLLLGRSSSNFPSWYHCSRSSSRALVACTGCRGLAVGRCCAVWRGGLFGGLAIKTRVNLSHDWRCVHRNQGITARLRSLVICAARGGMRRRGLLRMPHAAGRLSGGAGLYRASSASCRTTTTTTRSGASARTSTRTGSPRWLQSGARGQRPRNLLGLDIVIVSPRPASTAAAQTALALLLPPRKKRRMLAADGTVDAADGSREGLHACRGMLDVGAVERAARASTMHSRAVALRCPRREPCVRPFAAHLRIRRAVPLSTAILRFRTGARFRCPPPSSGLPRSCKAFMCVCVCLETFIGLAA